MKNQTEYHSREKGAKVMMRSSIWFWFCEKIDCLDWFKWIKVENMWIFKGKFCLFTTEIVYKSCKCCKFSGLVQLLIWKTYFAKIKLPDVCILCRCQINFSFLFFFHGTHRVPFVFITLVHRVCVALHKHLISVCTGRGIYTAECFVQFRLISSSHMRTRPIQRNECSK